MFDAVKISNKKNTIAHVYSGMAILKKNFSKDFKNYKTEEKLYPQIIKK